MPLSNRLFANNVQILRVQVAVTILKHAHNCKDVACRFYHCQKMRKLLLHEESCPGRGLNVPKSSCRICKEFLLVCFYHSRSCCSSACTLPYCPQIKKKLQVIKLKRNQKQHREAIE